MTRKSKLKAYIAKLKEFYFKHGFIPDFESVSGIFGLKSKSTVHDIFKKLLGLWYLVRCGNKFFPWEKLLSLPMFESIKAWFPSPASEDNKYDINVQEYLIDKPNSTVLLKVKWDSMIDEGIKTWDMVIVDKSLQVKQWDIVVAVVDGDYTMKYFMKDAKQKVFLRAANAKYDDIYPENELEIFGVVSGVIRKYR